jgi:hypothetical protein
MDIFRYVRGALLLFIACGFLPQNCAVTAPRGELDRPKDILKYQIEAAKEAGSREIIFIQKCNMPSGINSLAQILAEYSLLRVRVMDKETTISDDIRRWVKLKVLEVIHRQNTVDDEPLVEGAPPCFFPLRPSECILIEPGAAATIDGIHVERLDRNDYTLIRGREYLMAAYLQDGGKRITSLGPDSIFAITGSTLYPLATYDREVVRDVEQVYGNDLDRIRLSVRQYQELEKK